MEKSALRKLYMERRRALLPDKLHELTSAVVDNFSKISFDGIKFLHVFYPIIGKAEFDSLQLIDWLRTAHPEIKLVLPKSDLINHTLTHIIWQDDTPLVMNNWGITEPESGIEVQPEQIDLVLVPLLAYDKKGNRIGYGKGFYDRFLHQCRPDVVKAGISFFPPEEEIEGIDAHDIPLDLCISAEKVWRFKKW